MEFSADDGTGMGYSVGGLAGTAEINFAFNAKVGILSKTDSCYGLEPIFV